MRLQKGIYIATVLAFLTALWVPLIGMPLTSDEAIKGMENAEKRRMASMPEWPGESLDAFPSQFADYFADHIGFRRSLIRGYNRLSLSLFGESPVKHALVGKDGWYYRGGPNPLAVYLRTNPFTPAELLTWRDSLEIRHDWLAKKGVRYLFAVTPNKSTIYPEYMPDRVRRMDNPARIEQLMRFLKAHSYVPVVDMRGMLTAEKENGQMYYKTDSHWNELGGYMGYRQLTQMLSKWYPAVVPHPLSDYRIEEVVKPGRELVVLLDLKDVITETVQELKPLYKKCSKHYDLKITGKVDQTRNRKPFGSHCEQADLPTMFMFRDSFSIAMIPHLEEHFSDSRFVFSRYRPAVMKEALKVQKPDLVIEQIVENKLHSHMPSLSPRQKQRVWRQSFNASENVLLAALSTPGSLARGGVWKLKKGGKSRQFPLGEIKATDDQWPVARILINSKAKGLMAIEYREQGEWKPIERKFAAGESDLFFGIPVPGYQGELRLTFPGMRENAAITFFQVRAASLDSPRTGQVKAPKPGVAVDQAVEQGPPSVIPSLPFEETQKTWNNSFYASKYLLVGGRSMPGRPFREGVWNLKKSGKPMVFPLGTINVPADWWPIARIRIKSPAREQMTVEFQQDGQWKPITITVFPGKSDLFFGIPVLGYSGPLRLTFPELRADSVISFLQVRGVTLGRLAHIAEGTQKEPGPPK